MLNWTDDFKIRKALARKVHPRLFKSGRRQMLRLEHVLNMLFTMLLRKLESSGHIPTTISYSILKRVSIRLLRSRRLSCFLLSIFLRDHTKLVHFKRSKDASIDNCLRQLLKAIEKVDGLFASAEEVLLERETR
jgi:hypothetical protein